MNNKKGITLVALVVSIIVLLILSAVSLSLTVGDNGIIAKTFNSKKQEQLSNVETEVMSAVKRLEYYNIASSDVGKNIFSLSNIAELRKYLEGKLNGVYQRANGNVVMYYDKDNVSYTIEIDIRGRVVAKEGTILYTDFATTQMIEMPTGGEKTFSSPYEETIWVVIDPKTREVITDSSIAYIDPITGKLTKNTNQNIIVRGYDKNDTTNNTYVDIKVVEKIPTGTELALDKIKEQIDMGKVIGNGDSDSIEESDPDAPSPMIDAGEERPEITEDDTIIYRLGDNVYGAVVDKNSNTYTFEVFTHNDGDGIFIPISDEVYTNNTIDIKENTLIKKLIIDEGVTKLIPEVFVNFVNVEYLSIPSTITTFGADISPFAPNSTTGMNNVKTLEYNAINIIGSGITDNNMFGYTNVNNVIIGDKVEVIPLCFMTNNNSLAEINIPGNVKEIKASAFYNCNNLENVVLNEGIEILGKNAFAYAAIRKIVIPNSVIEIGMNAFYENTNLEEVTMGNNVDYIGSAAFYDCIKLTEFTIPESVTRIGATMLGKCKNIETLNYNAINASYYGYSPDEKNGVSTQSIISCNTYTSETDGASASYYDSKQPDIYSIPNKYWVSNSSEYLDYSHASSYYVNAGSKYYTYQLTTKTITSTETRIITKTIPYSYDVIEPYEYNTNETYTYYVKKNGEYVPYTTTKDLAHTGVQSITRNGAYTTHVKTNESFQKTVSYYETVEHTATSRTHVSVPSIKTRSYSYQSTYYSAYLRGYTYSLKKYTYESNNLKTINIGNNVKIIPANIFAECTKITNISIPSSVETIGNYAFWGCTGLNSITFNSGIKSIGEKSFKKCINLTRLEIPDTIESIGHLAFEECYKVNTIKMQHTLDGEIWGLTPNTKSGNKKYTFHKYEAIVNAPGVRIEYEEE